MTNVMHCGGCLAAICGVVMGLLRPACIAKRRRGDAPFGTIQALGLDERDQSRLRVSTDRGIWELRDAPERIFVDSFSH